MVDKHALHHTLVVLRQARLWQLAVLLGALVLWSGFLLRQNNLHMVERRNLVMQADQNGTGTTAALTELQRYVTAHMNTSMGSSGLYLVDSYQRDYQQAIARAQQSGGATGRAYTAADQDCRQLFSVPTEFQGYTQCISDRIAVAASPSAPIVAVSLPAASLYHYNFVSPVWSPDVAGWTVLATGMLAVLVASRIVLEGIVLLLLRTRRRAP